MNPVIVALDVATAREALALADALRDVVGGFKVGKQLFAAEGPSAIRALAERGDRVFLDLKFHDIPNTVAGAVTAAVATGAWMVNVHASGGRAMMRAAADAASATAEKLGGERPLIIAVTVLTSLDDGAMKEIGVGGTVRQQVVRLARLAQDSGLDGVVASPLEIADIRAACGDAFTIVTPGIRPEGQTRQDDQLRTMSPRSAVEAGADYLVVGRPITSAPDPREAAKQIARDIEHTTVR
jgi:orotidine-5'-phosphate decarboxylase